MHVYHGANAYFWADHQTFLLSAVGGSLFDAYPKSTPNDGKTEKAAKVCDFALSGRASI